MAEHIEDIVDVREVMDHLRVAMYAYQAHAEQMEQVVEAGGLKDFMTADAAKSMAMDHRQHALDVNDMLTTLNNWYYDEEE